MGFNLALGWNMEYITESESQCYLVKLFNANVSLDHTVKCISNCRLWFKMSGSPWHRKHGEGAEMGGHWGFGPGEH